MSQPSNYPQRIGFVCSGGGASFAKAAELLARSGRRPELVVVSDREGPIQQYCADLDIPLHLIDSEDREKFSERVASLLFGEYEVNWVCLLYSKLVSSALFDAGECVNIHPSLLPNHPGMGAVKRAYASGATLLGATAHRVNATVDEGPVIVQLESNMPSSATLNDWKYCSYIQKVLLILLLVDQHTRWSGDSKNGFVQLDNRLADASLSRLFSDFQYSEGSRCLIQIKT